MNRLIIWFCISLTVTVFAWTSPFHSPGLELLLIPIILVLILAGLTGLGTLPSGLFKLVKKKPVNKWITIINGIALGYYLGYIILIPIDNWDKRQRNLSGKIIAEKLEEHKVSHGKYPGKLSDLDTTQINTSLPYFYKLNRFNYSVQDKIFDLDIPIPMMDRWHWNNETKEFVYSDW